MSTNDYTPDARCSLERAARIARQHNHRYLTLEHLLAALLDEPVVCEALSDLRADSAVIAKDCRAFLEEMNEYVGPGPGTLYTTPDFNRVLNRAKIAAENESRATSSIDLMAALLEEECRAAHFLIQQGVHQEALLTTTPQKSNATEPASPTIQTSHDFLTDLNNLAARGEIDPVVGRTEEINRVIQTLLRRRKNNPVLVGEPGVGKTAIAEGLALAIVQNEVPESLREARVFSVDIAGMLAGTKFRGDFEERLKKTIKRLETTPGAIAFIDEIHIITAGSGGQAIDAANILKPFLQTGKIKVLGATTYKEWRQHIEKDPALARRFQKIDVAEISPEDTKNILRKLKPFYEKHHRVAISEEAIETAVDLSVRYIRERRLPDKAIDLLDEACSAWRLASPTSRATHIDRNLIIETITKLARLPKAPQNQQDLDHLSNLLDKLKQEIFGQDHALDSLVNAVLVARAGLRDPERPIGSFLFQGPTGVGKTETARALAKYLDLPLHRFDMSEYMEKHSISRLIGAPPGYTGHDQGGLLTETLSKQPSCILLFDEIEKAHPDIVHILLQVLDAGRLTDSSGKTTDFRQSIIILTTNLGAREATMRPIGFLASETGDPDRARQAIEQHFPPELRNRLDAIISFAPLGRNEIKMVVQKEITKLRNLLAEKNITLTISDEAESFLVQKGYDPGYGARPLARTIQKHIKEPLARAILFGPIKQGGTVHVTIANNTIHIITEPTKP